MNCPLKLYTVLLFALLQKKEGDAAKILFFSGQSSYSQRISIWPLAEVLAENGHNVTFLSPYPSREGESKVVDLVPKWLENWASNWELTEHLYPLRATGHSIWSSLLESGVDLCEAMLNDPTFVKWIKETPFDLVIVDGLMNECAYGIAFIHKAKTILYDSAMPYQWYVETIGYPDESSWVPDVVGAGSRSGSYYPEKLTFFQRAMALINPIRIQFIREFKIFPKLESKIRKTLAPHFSSILEMERNVSLLLVNQHYSEDFPRSFPPNVIPVGGMQCSDGNLKPLERNLSLFLDDVDRTKGFIYMSFGSFGDSSMFPSEVQQIFVNVLKRVVKSGTKIVWKLNGERPKDLPKEIFTTKWAPQQTVLAHPMLKLFISHTGMGSTHESIFHAVPVLAFPFFADQDYNANKLAWKGVALKLELTTISENVFMHALSEMLQNPKYKRNMEKLSQRFRDRPSKTVDTAAWWVEYVLRYSDASPLRPLSVYQPWWKKRQLDILCAIWILLTILGFILIYCILTCLTVWLDHGKIETSNKKKYN